MGPFHKRYLTFQAELEEYVESVKDKAKTLKREDFEKAFEEDWFEDHRPDSE